MFIERCVPGVILSATPAITHLNLMKLLRDEAKIRPGSVTARGQVVP